MCMAKDDCRVGVTICTIPPCTNTHTLSSHFATCQTKIFVHFWLPMYSASNSKVKNENRKRVYGVKYSERREKRKQ